MEDRYTISEIGKRSDHLNSKTNYTIGKIIEEILDCMYDGIYITDGNGVTLFINKSYSSMSGIKKEDAVGFHMQDLIKKGYFLESASLKVIETKKPVSIIDCFSNGKKCLATANPVFDENGQIKMVVTNLRDMTELLDLKNQLEELYDLNKKYYFELKELRKDIENKYNIIGNSKSMIEIYEIIDRIAETDATVLVLGETGVGKEVVAREIHKNSLRKNGPFIKVNCASIPESLFESEMFGYASGAFTGADNKGKPGLIELANKGTLLLDEIGELSLSSQSKLLRVLEENKVTRVGGTEPINIDVRIIAATNRDLKKEVEKGTFREDLFYRLNVIPIYVPPLRERKEDIPLLSKYFLDLYNSKYNKTKTLSHKAFELLKWYSWPGNVRQLKNLIERLVLTCPYDIITDDYISGFFGKEEIEELYNLGQGELTLDEAVSTIERQLIQNALKKYRTTRKAAKALGVSQPTIVRKCKKYGITIE